VSVRLTADELAELSAIVNAFLPSRGLVLWCRLLMDRIEDDTELRERRALDLSDEEASALRDLRSVTGTPWGNPKTETERRHNRAIAVLDRLLADKGAKP
jgi:hypothetical protein